MELLVICGAILFTITSHANGQPQYEVQIKFPVTYSFWPGTVNQLADGSCCSLDEQIPNCFSPCLRNESRINLCFREAGHSENDTDLINNCPLGAMTLNPARDETGVVTLNPNATITNTTTYPGSYQLFFEIILHSLQQTRKIGSGRITFMHSVEDGFISPVIIQTETAALSIAEIRVVCREGYFGPDCGCSPRNDSTGHFTCATDGTVVCLHGYQDPDTNCTVEALTAFVGRPSPLAILSIAVGGALGGVALMVIIVSAVVVVVCMCVSRSKRKRKRKVVMAMATLRDTAHSNNTHKDNSDALNWYSTINKDAKTRREEPPPINPYQGDIYTEVEKTGLFAKSVDTSSTEKEPLYSTPTHIVFTSQTKSSEAGSCDTNVGTGSTNNRDPQYADPVGTLKPSQPQSNESGDPGYSEIDPERADKQPKIVYADLEISDGHRSTPPNNTQDELEKVTIQVTTCTLDSKPLQNDTVQYSHIQNNYEQF